MWVATSDLPRSAAHPFYTRLNQILDEHNFDGYVEELCRRFYADEGRPGLPPARYFRLLLIGYFEGLDAERAIAWRAADSFALRDFRGVVLPETPPDHSTISRTRRLIDVETHEAVFTWILQRLADVALVKGKTVGIDATTLEANAALRSIVRRDTGESYRDFLTKLAQASGIETPTRADVARIDRKRKKKGSNDDWTHPHDPDAKITKMKDGRTHLAHKAEHVVDLETGAIVSVTVQDADDGDTTTSVETLIEAAEQVETVRPDGKGLEEVVGDKGYQANAPTIAVHGVARLRVLVPVSSATIGVQRCSCGRRRLRGRRATDYCYETGGMRRVYLRGHTNIRKRLLIHTGGFNLGLLMRTLLGVGTPRSLQGRAAALLPFIWCLIRLPETLWDAIWTTINRTLLMTGSFRMWLCVGVSNSQRNPRPANQRAGRSILTNIRELEPHWQMAPTAGRAPTGGSSARITVAANSRHKRKHSRVYRRLSQPVSGRGR